MSKKALSDPKSDRSAQGPAAAGSTAKGADGCTRELSAVREELATLNREYDELLSRHNQLAVDAEIAEIELSQIFNTAADAMVVIDDDFEVQRINQSMLNLLGVERAQALHRKCHELFVLPICATQRCPLKRLQRSGGKSIEADIRKSTPDGEEHAFILTAAPFWGLDGSLIGIVAAYKDITERKQAEDALARANAELQRMATIDGLTQVANRRCFDQRLGQEWHRARREKNPLSLILCDIDFFKRYNDTYGHQMGDDCLRRVARAIEASIRRPADLAARYGGEEFAVILPNTPVEGALHVAESIRRAVHGLQIVHANSEADGFVTLSLGVAGVVPSQAVASELFVQTADLALYQAKQTGRNRVAVRKLTV